MNLLITLLAFAVAIGVLVVVHEFGHYWVARRCGVKVLRFSIGFGKPLVIWRRGPDATEWAICALPLGGYVRMLDERDESQQVPVGELHRAFNRQSVGKRLAIVAAGPMANFLLAIVLYAGLNLTGVTEPVARLAAPPAGSVAARAGLIGGETVVAVRTDTAGDGPDESEPVRSWDELRWKMLDPVTAGRAVTLVARTGDGSGNRFDYALDLSGIGTDAGDDFMRKLGLQPAAQVLVGEILPRSAAEQAGLRAGDEIMALDGNPVWSVAGLVDAVREHAGKRVTLTVKRQNATMRIPIVPQPQTDANAQVSGRIGAVLAGRMATVEVRYGPLEAVRHGAQRTWDVTRFSLRMLGKMVTGQASLKNLSGPVTIADYAGKSARLGLDYYVAFLALVSISLGVLNLLPIPVLDGGYLLYYAVEAITGRAISERWQGVLQRIGLMFVLLLSAVALFNDLSKLLHF